MSSNSRGLTDYLNLHRFSPNPGNNPINSFFEYFDHLCENVNGYQDFEELQKIIELEPPRQTTNNIRAGYMFVGEYGIRQDLIDITTTELAFQREITHAGRMPFFYLIGIPRNSRVGFIFLEQFKGYSAGSVFKSLIKSSFQQLFPYNLLSYEKAATAQLIEGLYNSAHLKDLTVTSHTIPR
ncbi:MAG TPA: hypothetical protein VN132_03860, partial [Bdellovibrio sp.]|nr:hypothetical protein [Bdellovibrio sp.]